MLRQTCAEPQLPARDAAQGIGLPGGIVFCDFDGISASLLPIRYLGSMRPSGNQTARTVSFTAMRRLLFIFMIAILPLRGLVGDAMAVAMTTMPMSMQMDVQDVTMGATPCPDHVAAAQPEHEGSHGKSFHSVAHGDHAMGSDTTHHHAVCDLCNGPAMTRSVRSDVQPPSSHVLHVPPVERFASSEPHRGIKPPIS